MKRAGVSIAVAIGSLILSWAVPAHAQQRGGFLGQSLNLSETDIELQRKAARHALDELDDGEVEEWSNTESGYSGAVMPTNTYELKGLHCRDFRMRVRAARTRNLSLTACKQKDGTWKLYF